MENEMSRRKLLHYVGALGALSAYLREGRLFRVITGTPPDTQDSPRVAPPEFDWDLLARSFQDLERRYQSQRRRLATNENRPGATGRRKEDEGFPPPDAA